MCPPLTEREKRKSKIQNKPHSNTIGKKFLRIFKSMKRQSEVNLFQISSCMNIEQIKNMKSEPKKKSKNYNRKAITFTVHYNNIKLKYTAWCNIHFDFSVIFLNLSDKLVYYMICLSLSLFSVTHPVPLPTSIFLYESLFSLFLFMSIVPILLPNYQTTNSQTLIL